jgi:hypothetical protein
MMSNESVVDARVEEAVIACGPIRLPVNAARVELKSKFDLLRIKDTLKKPILRLGKEYYIIDTSVCYHYREV